MVDAVEHTVVGEGGRVVDVVLEVDEADHRGDALGLGDDVLQRFQVVADEVGLEQQVLRRVPGQGQLRERDQVGAQVAGPSDPVGDLLGVPPEVADREVGLGQGDPQRPRHVCLHGLILPAPAAAIV